MRVTLADRPGGVLNPRCSSPTDETPSLTAPAHDVAAYLQAGDSRTCRFPSPASEPGRAARLRSGRARRRSCGRRPSTRVPSRRSARRELRSPTVDRRAVTSIRPSGRLAPAAPTIRSATSESEARPPFPIQHRSSVVRPSGSSRCTRRPPATRHRGGALGDHPHTPHRGGALSDHPHRASSASGTDCSGQLATALRAAFRGSAATAECVSADLRRSPDACVDRLRPDGRGSTPGPPEGRGGVPRDICADRHELDVAISHDGQIPTGGLRASGRDTPDDVAAAAAA